MSNVRYEFTEKQAREDDPRVLYISVSKFGEDWLSLPHYHPHAELLFITNGAGIFRREGRDYPVKRGDLVIVNPNTLHTELSSPEKPLECLIVGVQNTAFMKGEKDEEREDPPVCTFLGQGDHLDEYVYAVERELAEKSPNYLSFTRHLACILLFCVMRRAGLRAVTRKGGLVAKECSFVRQYIDEHFAEDLSIDELAAKTFTNKYHLIHIFSREYGISPIAYLMEKRIEEARHLLRETRMSVTEISKMTGFSSPSFFAKRFKQSVRLSPLAYRNGGGNAGEIATPPVWLSRIFDFLISLSGKGTSREARARPLRGLSDCPAIPPEYPAQKIYAKKPCEKRTVFVASAVFSAICFSDALILSLPFSGQNCSPVPRNFLRFCARPSPASVFFEFICR